MARQRIVAAGGDADSAEHGGPQGPRRPASAGRPSGLARIFAVPDGEPVDARLAHIRQLTSGERLWFEQGVRVGDRVLVPYERLDDGKPAALAVDRLMRRCRCSAKEAFDLGEALLALDADPTVIAHYVAEARRRGVGPVLAELLAWAARLGAVAPGPDGDALDHAEPLGDDVERVTDAGELAAEPADAPDPDAATTPEPATLAWRVLGTIDPPRVRCPRCGTGYVADDDAPELPACPRCGTPDTWEARQPAAFRALLGAIEACPTRAALADLGRRLYAARLPARPGRGRVDALPDPPGRARRARSPLGSPARELLERDRGGGRLGHSRVWVRRSTAASTRPARPVSRRRSGGGSGPPTGRAGRPGRRRPAPLPAAGRHASAGCPADVGSTTADGRLSPPVPPSVTPRLRPICPGPCAARAARPPSGDTRSRGPDLDRGGSGGDPPGEEGSTRGGGSGPRGRLAGRDAHLRHPELRRRFPMETLTDVVQLDLVPLVSAALKEAARLTAAVEGLARELDRLTAELEDGELRDTNRLLGALLGQLGCPYERR